MAWSKAVNAAVAEWSTACPPSLMCARACRRAGQADVVVVSATPSEALTREWEEHAIARNVRGVIAGQEMGTKKQHLALAARESTRQPHPHDRRRAR